MRICLTGGTGYIGTHVATVLAAAGHELILFDNLSNSKSDVLVGLKKIIGKPVIFVEGDIRDTNLLIKVLKKYSVDAVIHLAGLKSVGVSVSKPLDYFSVNVQGTISLLQAMQAVGINILVFSSSATVYGDPQYLPIDEKHPKCANNPYGRTKLHIEEMLSDIAKSDPSWRIVCLRYFNPAGAHESGFIGEDPQDAPNNLMPIISRVASGISSNLKVFGDNYQTKDGTGVRDYLHIIDLAEGHLAALDFLSKETGWFAINLGTGFGTSVLELIKAYENASGKVINYQVVDRRPGDVGVCYASADRAKLLLNWVAKKSLNEMCHSVVNFNKRGLR
jgi:UDP-glucose 4-epimerase